jgi:hypothetical protein
MKTINKDMDIFTDLAKALRAFEKSKVECQLLESSFGGKAIWFVDRAKQAIIDWPKHYKIVAEK